MNRQTFIQQLGLIASGTLLLPPFFSKLRQAEAFHMMRGNIGYFTGRGGTIGWLVNDEVLVAVDSQFQSSASEFIAGIEGIGGGPEKFLFNTHHHGDHVSGNPVFSDLDFEIIAHEKVPQLQRASAVEQRNESEQVYAGLTFEEEFTLDAGREQITAKHYGPGHTGGDSVIWFRDGNIAHMGDLVFNRWYPFIDRNGGASIRNWIALLETVAGEADRDTLFIFGHGSAEFGITGNRDDVLYMRDYLSKLLEHTHQGIDAGDNRDEIADLEQFDEFPDHQSAGARLSLAANIQTAYDELTEDL